MIVFGEFYAFLSSILCVILHEMGHSLVGRKLGYKLNVITLMPYGAMLSGENSTFSKNDEIKIAIAGPIVNALLIILTFVLWTIFPATYSFLEVFMMANIYTLCFNLLPVYPLDGGRILQASLTSKVGFAKSKKITKCVGFAVTIIVILMFFVSFLFKLNYMLGINALFMLIGLLEEDNSAYYQKISNFERFRFAGGRTINLDASCNIFDAYKYVVEKNVSKIKLPSGKTYTKSQVLNCVLNYPLYTKLCEI